MSNVTRALGWAMVASPFVAIFVAIVVTSGLLAALAFYAVVGVIVAVVVGGAILATQ